MTYSQLIEEVKRLRFEEIRVDSGELFEIVLGSQSFKELHSLLEQYFGGPLKPAGQVPSREAENLTAFLGAVRKNQTFYCKKLDGGIEGALIWPWSGDSSATVKIFKN